MMKLTVLSRNLLNTVRHESEDRQLWTSSTTALRVSGTLPRKSLSTQAEIHLGVCMLILMW